MIQPMIQPMNPPAGKETLHDLGCHHPLLDLHHCGLSLAADLQHRGARVAGHQRGMIMVSPP